MRRSDYCWLIALLASGILLWVRTASHTALVLQETLPLLLAFPLFLKLGAPWKFEETVRPIPLYYPALALLLAAAGEVMDLPLLTTLGWTAALGAWLWFRSNDTRRPVLMRLLLLPLLGFPWLVGAAGGLGWQFRLSAAWVVEQCFTAAGFSIVREGTLLSVQGQPISVEAACSGLGSLQAMLLAGAAAAAIELGRHRRFWLCVPVLFIAAWFANTARVLFISATALSAGHDFASGTFHGLSGWAILVAVFTGCLALFRWMRRDRHRVVVREYAMP